MSPTNGPFLPGLAPVRETPPGFLAPAPGREEPAVWVSRLAVYRYWPPGPDSLLRQVFELRRGLNILWAKPTGATDEASRLAGHGAGKSTFCRLLRYVLGEKPEGTRAFREGFRGKFGDGWVLAEVVVAGQRWLVGRPLSHTGYDSFARAGGTLEDSFPPIPSNVGYKEDFLAAIDAAVFGKMRFRKLADSRRDLDWLRLLPWLSRDQEAHFSGLLEWRHKDSDHNSPEVSHEDRANLIRLVLGLVDKTEQDTLAEFARKASQHEEKARDRVKLEYAVERERRALEDAVKVKVEAPDQELLQQTVATKVAELQAQTSQALAARRQDDETDLLNAAVGQRLAEWSIVEAQIQEVEDAVAVAEAHVSNSQPPPRRTPNPILASINGLGPFRGFCSHPMSRAWEARCPIASQRPQDDEITQATRAIAAETQLEVARIAAMKADLKQMETAGAPKKQALEAAQTALRTARARHQNELEALTTPGREAARIGALLTGYQKACEDLKTWDADLATLRGEKEILDNTLADLATQHQKFVEQFSAIFNHLVRLMLGTAVTGSIRLKGKALTPELEYHGPRDSAAFKVVRWLLFDLAALALGMTNPDTHHPRLLIHDSPRESDLAAAIYTSLFTAARELENGPGPAAFQYIVTTTESPGDALKRSPWLMDPILDASVEEGRLLGADF